MTLLREWIWGGGVAGCWLEAAVQEQEYYVYILANTFHRLYTGVTGELMVRVKQHKERLHPKSFTARYKIDRLVYFERFQYVEDAIRRETEIKGWVRMKKIALIVAHNPSWRDLSEDWGKAVRFDGQMRAPQGF